MKRHEKLAGAAILITLLAIVALKVVWSQLIYDDWTCAFAECRKVK